MSDDRIALQNKEFYAVNELAKQWRRLQMTPVVDDDYPAVRHDYESALRTFIEALYVNRPNTLEEYAPAHVGIDYHDMDFVATISHARALRWHPKGLNSWSLSDWYTALAGEAGELGNVIKKMNRVRDEMQQKAVDVSELEEKASMEIGDTYIYLDLLAQRMGLKLAECVRATFNRVSEREGFPERL